jgi:hypothetical protein
MELFCAAHRGREPPSATQTPRGQAALCRGHVFEIGRGSAYNDKFPDQGFDGDIPASCVLAHGWRSAEPAPKDRGG